MLLSGRLFEGQYVLEDVILVGAAFVIAATLGCARLHHGADDDAER